MKKALLSLAFLALSLGLVASSAFASEKAIMGGFKMADHSKLIGAAVENSCDNFVGVINGIMVDPEGHAFAIINHGDYELYGDGGGNTPVPIEELRISRTNDGQQIAFLKTDMEHFDLAPYLDPLQTNSRQYEASLYEYYGIQPYWTEGARHFGVQPRWTERGQRGNMDLYRWGGEAQDF
jgi:hypothetical protein